MHRTELTDPGISTTPEYPRDHSIQKLFEEIAETYPGNSAVTFGNETLTYAQLNERANQVAHRLIDLGAGPDRLVGCCCERSIDLIVILVGILKSGAAYVPLDPEYPEERLAFMLADTAPVAIVSTTDTMTRLPITADVPVVCVNKDNGKSTASNPPRTATAKSAAYVMYTSGSTGKPKGVVTEQRAIVRLVRNTNFCTFGPSDVWLHYAPLAFDASTLEIWGALLNGGAIAVAPPKASLEELGKVIREKSITSAWLTTGLFNLMVENRLADMTGLRQLLTGGDVVSPAHARRAREALPDCVLINGYGPTENTTFTCCHVMRPGDPIPEPIPIGRPIANTTVYILDADGNPVPTGETGELYTGGDGVARGYLNNLDATAEKFLPDPFADSPDARMYRTGDLARWRPDGTVDFLGRVDNQVKILGHRIEPGEIEVAVANHPHVSDACITVHTDDAGSKRLIAYYVARDGALAPDALRSYLAQNLPRYMMPGLLVPMCALPLNVNGKVDRAALPKPDFGDAAQVIELSPGSSVEENITAAWQRVLKTANFGPTDNFFDIGGDSLKLAAAHAEIERQLGREIPIIDLFEHTTVKALSEHLGGPGAVKSQDKTTDKRGSRQRDAFARSRQRRKKVS